MPSASPSMAPSKYGIYELGQVWGGDEKTPLDFETSVWVNVILDSLWMIEKEKEGGLGPYIGQTIAEVLNLEVRSIVKTSC